MKPKYWLVLGVVAAAAAQSAACSSKFESCSESRTCPPKTGSGGTGDAGDAAQPEAAGAPENSENGGAAGDTAAPANEAGAAGEGGALEPACTANIDLNSDPKNCGSCGHDCLGGECTSGSCAPIKLATDQGRLFTVAVDDQFIYWGGDNAAIAKTRLDGSGMAKTLVPKGASEFSYFWALASDQVFWSNDWHDTGLRGCMLPDCSGGPQTMVSSPSYVRAMAFDSKNKHLYWAQDDDGIWHRSVDGVNAASFLSLTNVWVTAMATDSAFLYWSEYDRTTKLTAIKKTPVGSIDVRPLAVGLAGIEDISVQGDTLYVIEDSGPNTEIRTIPLPNGVGATPPRPIGSGAAQLKLVTDASGLYWPAGESIETCPLSGCGDAPKSLAAAEKAWGITTDAKAVYWVTETGSVMKVAK